MPVLMDYTRFVKPAVGKLLSSLGLDVYYHRGLGDQLFYFSGEKEIQVTDFLGGYGAGFFGHNHPALVQEVVDFYQQQIPTQSQLSDRKGAGQLAKKLSEMIGRETGKEYVVTFSNSGAEAVESAMKHAEFERSNRCRAIQEKLEFALDSVQNDRKKGDEISIRRALEHNARVFLQRPYFVILENSYHGKTAGALSVTANEKFRDPFKALLLKKLELSWNEPECWNQQVEDAHTKIFVALEENNSVILSETDYWNLSAILVEPIQGEGGIRVLSRAAAAELESLSVRTSTPVISDEIQSGMGRSGDFLASTGVGLKADYFVLSKSLGGGLCKIGAFAVTREKYIEEFGLIHSSTFAEDELSSRVALRSLEILISDKLEERARLEGEYILEKLAAIKSDFPDVVQEVRGKGLMLGIEFRHDTESGSNTLRMFHETKYFGYLISSYLLKQWNIRVGPSLSSPCTLRIEPSAYIDERSIEHFCMALRGLCEALRAQNVLALVKHLVAEPVSESATKESFRRHRLHARRDAPTTGIPKAGFIGHLLSVLDLRILEPSFASLSDSALAKLYSEIDDKLEPVQFDRIRVKSITGVEAELNFFGLLEGPLAFGRALERRSSPVLEKKIQEVADMAKGLGCQTFGLGALNSVIMNNGLRLMGRGMAVTTGNSFTVKAGITALKLASESQGIDLKSSRAAVIGATGNIGSVYGMLLSQDVDDILLLGRTNSVKRLESVALKSIQFMGQKFGFEMGSTSPIWQKLKETNAFSSLKGSAQVDWLEFGKKALRELEHHSPFKVSTNMYDLKTSSLILSASNAVDPIIAPEHLGDQVTVIVDVAAPQDVSEEVLKLKPNAKVIHGGLIRVPNDPDFGVIGLPMPRGYCYACFAETIILAMKGCQLNFSYGSIKPEQVEIIGGWADELGFEVVEYYRPRPQVLFGRDYRPSEQFVPSLTLS